MSKKKEKARALEQRKKDLSLRVRGLKYLAVIGAALWAFFLLGLLIIPERAWMFRVIWCLYSWLFAAILVASMTEYANIKALMNETGRDGVKLWTQICGIAVLGSIGLFLVFYALFKSIPGMAFVLFALPGGCALSFLIFNHDSKSEEKLNWGLMAFWAGMFSGVLLILTCAGSYAIGDEYDARYAIGMFGTPLLIFNLVTGIRAWRRHNERIDALPELEPEDHGPVLRIITGGLYKKPERDEETGDEGVKAKR